MDAFDVGALRALQVLVGLLLIALILLGVGWWLEQPPPPPAARTLPEWTEQERDWIAARQRHHGIAVSIYADGEHYFYRDDLGAGSGQTQKGRLPPPGSQVVPVTLRLTVEISVRVSCTEA